MSQLKYWDGTAWVTAVVGAQGATGATGATGTAATIAAGTTTTGAAGTSATVTNAGTSSAAVFNFVIPRGDTGTSGTSATVNAGTTTTGAAGTSASVVNSGTSSAAIFDFTIPRGDTGATGSSGVIAVTAPITNSGTSTSANIGIDTANFALLNTTNTFTNSPQQINAVASSVGLIVKANATGTANIQQWQNSGGGVIAAVLSSGYVLTSGLTDVAGNGAFLSTATGGSISINTRTSTIIGLIVKGVASQSADLQQWQNSSGTVLASISSAGNVASGNTSTSGSVLANDGYFNQVRARAVTSPVFYLQSGQVLLDTNGTTKIGLVVKGVASQTANLQEWQNSAGTVLTNISSAGTINVSATPTIAFTHSNGIVIANDGSNNGIIRPFAGGGVVKIRSSGATSPALIVFPSSATQSSDYQQWQNSSGTILSGVNAAGQIYSGPTAGMGSAGLFGYTSATASSTSVAAYSATHPSPIAVVGQTITFAGFSPAYFNGTFVITSITGTSGAYVYTVYNSAASFTASGTSTFAFLSRVSANLSVISSTQFVTPLTVQAASGQFVNIQEWQNISGGVISAIDSAGNFTKGDGDQLVLAGQVFG